MRIPKIHIEKTTLVGSVLWISFILTMSASIQHLAWVFGTIEQKGHDWLGWIPAISLDAGLAALAYTIQQRQKQKKPTLVLWIGVSAFAIISALANLYHALSVEAIVSEELKVLLSSSFVVYAKAIVLSATLPIMYIFLGEIVGNKEATEEQEKKQAEQEVKEKQTREEQLQRQREEREQRKQERQQEIEQKKLEIEQQKLLLEQERTKKEQGKIKHCNLCGQDFQNRQAYAAHSCMKKNGKNQEPISNYNEIAT